MSKRLYLPWILPEHPGAKRKDLWPVRGLEHLDQALEGGRGVVLVTAHLGYVRMMAFILRVHGYQVMQVAARGPERESLQRERTERVSRGRRCRRYVYERTRVITDGIKPYHIAAKLDVRPIMKALEANKPVLIPGDGMRATEFVELPLLGREYPFASGYMKLALMMKAPMLPAFAMDGRGGGILIDIQPPLEIDPQRSIKENLKLYATSLESQIEKTPHLWHRWRVGEDCFEQARAWSRANLQERYDSGAGTQLSRRWS